MIKYSNEHSLKKWIIINGIIILFLLLPIISFWSFCYRYFYKNTLIFQDCSPNSEHQLTVFEIGSPRIYTSDVVKVCLNNNSANEEIYSFKTEFVIEIPNNGSHANFDVQWLENGVAIVFHGINDLYYFLPFQPDTSLEIV